MKSLLIISALFIGLTIQSQEWKHEIGLRGGQTSGITSDSL
jgi:hypothetical protein